MRKTAFIFIAILSLFSAAFAEDLYKSDVEASFYAEKFDGHTTASGEVYNMNDFTAAHKVLPFGTVVKVTNLVNGKSVDVRINDRGPFIKGREIDVSKAAAVSLGMMMDGTARVSIQIVKLPESTLETVATEAVKDEPVVEVAKDEILEEDKNVENKHWDIQVGAFSNAKNAETTAKRLVKAGFKNVVYQKTSTVTRVIILDIPTDEVQDNLDKLEKNGFTDHLVQEHVNPSSLTNN